MAGSHSLSNRATTLFLFGFSAVAAGCTAIFGFERPGDIVSCVHDSDCSDQFVCLSNTCTFACAQAEDCHALGFAPGTAACMGNQCVSVGSLDAGAGDGPTNETVDAQPDAADAAPPAESGTPEASLACTHACPLFSLCDDASCLDFRPYGYPGPGPQEQAIVSDKLVSLKILPDVCGYLTGIGFVTAQAVQDQRIRLGLYTDNSGVPDQLIAQTAPATVGPGKNELAVETTPLIGCDDVAPHYWIAGVWDDGTVSFEASASEILFQADTNGDAVGFIASLDRAADDQIDAGLPPTFPTPAPPLVGVTAMPHIYVIVARTN